MAPLSTPGSQSGCRERRRAGTGGHYARALMASTRRPAAARLALFLSRERSRRARLRSMRGLRAGPTATTQAPSPAQRLVPVEQAAVAKAEAAVAVAPAQGVPGRRAPTLPERAFVRPFPHTRSSASCPTWEVGELHARLPSLDHTRLLGRGPQQRWLDRSRGRGLLDPHESCDGADIRSCALRRRPGARSRSSRRIRRFLHSVAANPSTAGPRSARHVVALLSALDFDGVDLDL